MNKLVYKSLSLSFGVVGGLVAGAAFKRLWKLVSAEREVPTANDLDRGWGEVLAAAAVQGAVFALVKALVDRGSAIGARKLTGN